MNIFYLSDDPKECAKFHSNKHCVKMILETAQMLSTAHRVVNPATSLEIYKKTHANHPSTVWVRESKQNYTWLTSLLTELCKEYTFRYEKTHKVEASGLLNTLINNIPDISNKEFTPPPRSMPDYCKISEDVVECYRFYYVAEKHKILDWKKRMKPLWINKYKGLRDRLDM